MNARATRLRSALLSGRHRPPNHGAGSPASYRGDGYEFAELRQYLAGDDPRRIDWAATARVGELQTRVILEDVALTLAAIVDDSGSMQVGRHRPLLDAAREALHEWYAAASTDDRCVRVSDRGVTAPPGMRGRSSASACMNASTSGDLHLVASLEIARVALQRGTALLVVSDFFEITPAHRQLLAQLASRFDCTALLARDPWADTLPLKGFVRIRDAETAQARLLFLGKGDILRYYDAVRKRQDEVLGLFTTAGWRNGLLEEDDGARSLFNAFGLR